MFQLAAEGYLLGVLVSLPIGPVTIALMRRALTDGFWSAVAFGGGSASADLLYISLVYFGVAPLLAEVAWLRVALWLLGGLWLGWLGVDAIRGALRPPQEAEDGAGYGIRRSYVSGVGITLLNPLTVVSWLALGGGYFALHPLTRTVGGGMLALAAIVGGLMSHVVVVALVLATGRRWLKPNFVRALAALAGVILLVIALNFLVSALHGALVGGAV